MSPIYLFYGESEFQLEKVLSKIRETLIPEDVREFNLHTFYGDEKELTASSIIDAASSFPFMSDTRLITLRRTEALPEAVKESLVPYIERPLESTCLIFVSSRPDFRKRFYKTIRERGICVNFKKLQDREVIPWIQSTAEDMGLKLEGNACTCLQQIVGNHAGELYSELEKLHLRHGGAVVNEEQVKESAIFSRMYTVFELVDEIADRRGSRALSVLNRFLEEEGEGAALRVMGMVTRQIRLLWQARSIVNRGGGERDVVRKLGIRGFAAGKLIQQARQWHEEYLYNSIQFLYESDGHMKSGAHGRLVLESVVLRLCA
jgi:DNA polymerase-3 subunit delta